MTNGFTKALAMLAVTALAACGGGSGGGSTSERPPVTTPNPDTSTGGNTDGTGGNTGGTGGVTTPNNPSSNSAADLAKFAKAENLYRDNRNGSRTYSATADDGRHVELTTLPGYGNTGMVRVDRDNQLSQFKTAGNSSDVLKVQNGVYTGELQTSYRQGKNGAVQTANGAMAMEMDFKKGTGMMDSIVGNDNNVIEVMGSVKVQNGRVVHNNMVTSVRDGQGKFMFDTKNTLDAVVVGSGKAAGILGAVGARDTANQFELNGGFAATYDPKYN